jgi:hypothetical protein
MITYFQKGAMYAELESHDKIEQTPVEIGDGILRPGEFVSRLGEKKRSSFEMKDGFYLRYEGRIGKTILFNVNNYENDGIFYAFNYISPTKLLVVGGGKGCDIDIEHLEKVPNPQFKTKTVYQQLELDLF